MDNSPNSIYSKTYDPVLQTSIVFGFSMFVMLISWMVNKLGWAAVSGEFYWSIAATFILFFALFNSIISISAKNLDRYWGRSMLCFAALAIGSGFVAYLLSSLPIGEAGTYKWIYFVLTIGYLVFLSIIGFMKRIVEFAEKEDWQAPKKKKKR